MFVLKWLILFFAISSKLYADQKVVVISGASGGLGIATARAFHDEGWIVWAGIRKNIPEELQNKNNIRFCNLDVTNDSVVEKAFQNILEKDGKIDVLINNAGFGIIGAEECVTIEEAKALFEVNFFGSLRLIQAVLPSMRKRKTGHIINISSILGVRALPGLGLYSASKYALEGMSESLAATLENWNIRVAIVEPGPLKNNWKHNCSKGSRSCYDELYDKLNNGTAEMVFSSEEQSCEEVALLLVEIANASHPNLRYQTSSSSKRWVEEKLSDPSGMIIHAENLEIIKTIIDP